MPRAGRQAGRRQRPPQAAVLAAGTLGSALIAGSLLYLLPGPVNMYAAPAAASAAALAASSPLLGALASSAGSLAAYLALVAAAVRGAGASAVLRVLGATPILVGAIHLSFIASGVGVLVWHARRLLQARGSSG
ncbi:MAG: hypothetical protein LRS49_03540 [Desulfurococcales archaeon]|nr:hypothetical protein [Desulfurococcales archaeon]